MNYEMEAKERFGGTDAYKEYEQKTANYSKDKCQEVNDGLMAVFYATDLLRFEPYCKQN